MSCQSPTTYLTADELKQIAAIWPQNEGPPALIAAGNTPIRASIGGRAAAGNGMQKRYLAELHPTGGLALPSLATSVMVQRMG